MDSSFAGILLFIITAIIFVAGGLLASGLLRPSRPNPEKNTSYECGEDPIGSAWGNFNMRFYIVALIFILFEVEIAFLFPWATVFGNEKYMTEKVGTVKLDPGSWVVYSKDNTTPKAELLKPVKDLVRTVEKIASVQITGNYGEERLEIHNEDITIRMGSRLTMEEFLSEKEIRPKVVKSYYNNKLVEIQSSSLRPALQDGVEIRSSWGIFTLAEMGIFIFLLCIALIYAWVKGYLDWVKPKPEVSTYKGVVPDEKYELINKTTYTIANEDEVA